jgi:phosphoglycolate phosphatase
MKKLVLFDVDGTLIATRGAGRRAIHAALLKEIGVEGPLNGVRFDGKTDPQIVRELLQVARHPEDEIASLMVEICERYLGLLVTELDVGPAPQVYPGVHELLDALEDRSDTVVGLLTGNLARGARLKLNAAGIVFERFRVGAFGSDHPERAELPAVAVERAATMMGSAPDGKEVVIIGDTPADMTCGRGIGARAIGVATGSYTTDELLDAGGYTAVPDFADPEPVLAAIYA